MPRRLNRRNAARWATIMLHKKPPINAMICTKLTKDRSNGLFASAQLAEKPKNSCKTGTMLVTPNQKVKAIMGNPNP